MSNNETSVVESSTAQFTQYDQSIEETPEALKQALAKQDLKGLSEESKMKYLFHLSESLGFNPLTKPFEILSFRGQEKVYPTKSAASQAAANSGLSFEKTDEEMKEVQSGVWLYKVWYRGTLPDGRADEDMGAVPIYQSDDPGTKCDKQMKAVTKAKRRLALSITGIGLDDRPDMDGGRKDLASHEDEKKVQELNEKLSSEVSESMGGSMKPSAEGDNTEKQTELDNEGVSGSDSSEAKGQQIGDTVKDVKQSVKDGQITADQALMVEKQNKERKTLIEWLESRIDEDDDLDDNGEETVKVDQNVVKAVDNLESKGIDPDKFLNFLRDSGIEIYNGWDSVDDDCIKEIIDDPNRFVSPFVSWKNDGERTTAEELFDTLA